MTDLAVRGSGKEAMGGGGGEVVQEEKRREGREEEACSLWAGQHPDAWIISW